MRKLLFAGLGLWGAMLLAQEGEGREIAATEDTPTTQAATTQPSGPPSIDAERTLERLLRARPGTARPVEPVSPQEASEERRPRAASVAPRTPAVPLKREGDMVVQRVGRLEQVQDGAWEFRFESDGRQLFDPPMVILPNSRLAEMENALRRAGGDLRFQVTGMVTQYRGRNYLLIEKTAEVVTDHEGL